MIPFLCRIVYITFFNKALDNGQLPTGLQAPPHAGVDSVPLLASVPGEAFVPREQGAISSPWHAIRHGRVLSREFVIPRQQHFLPQAKVWLGHPLLGELIRWVPQAQKYKIVSIVMTMAPGWYNTRGAAVHRKAEFTGVTVFNCFGVRAAGGRS